MKRLLISIAIPPVLAAWTLVFILVCRDYPEQVKSLARFVVLGIVWAMASFFIYRLK